MATLFLRALDTMVETLPQRQGVGEQKRQSILGVFEALQRVLVSANYLQAAEDISALHHRFFMAARFRKGLCQMGAIGRTGKHSRYRPEIFKPPRVRDRRPLDPLPPLSASRAWPNRNSFGNAHGYAGGSAAWLHAGRWSFDAAGVHWPG